MKLRIKHLILFFALSFVLIACDESVDNDDGSGTETNYLVFGHYYGECIGDGCIRTYHLEGDKLQEDSNDNYGCAAPYDWDELPNSKYQEASSLFNLLPDTLYTFENQTFGIPDAYDQGGVYLETYGPNGNKRQWHFDTNKEEIPEPLRPLVDSIQAVISRISQ